MYRRYQATQQRPISSKQSEKPPVDKAPDTERERPKAKKQASFITRLIPQSLYNPETGKVLGVLNADDLFLIALIILILDSGEDGEDNSLLVYAILYILLSEYLPF